MSIFSERAKATAARIDAEFASKESNTTNPSYLQDTPDSKVLTDPRALADIRSYYSTYEGRLFADDKEMLNAFHDDQSWSNLNTFGIGSAWAEASSAPTAQQAHMARLSTLYEKAPDLWKEGGFSDHIGGFNQTLNIGKALLADPVNLAGFGAGGVVAKGAARGAVAAGKGGMGAGIKAAAKKGALVEGALAAPIAMGQDALMQGYQEQVSLRDEYSLSEGLLQGAVGGVAGGVLGGIMGAVAGIFGARIGAKEAQTLLDAGYTPASIAEMSEADIAKFISPEAVTPNMEAQAARDAEYNQYDTPASTRNKKPEAATEEPTPEVDPDSDSEVVSSALAQVEKELKTTTDKALRGNLRAMKIKLTELGAVAKNFQAREIQITERMGDPLTTPKEMASLRADLESLLAQQDEIQVLRTEGSSAPKKIKEAEEPTQESPAAVDEAAPAPKVDEPDAVEDAVDTSTTSASGPKKKELTDESIALLKEMGVKQERIDKAISSPRSPLRKKLMRIIVESKQLLEEGEDVNALSIGDLAARIKAYTDANPPKVVDAPLEAAPAAKASPEAEAKASPEAEATASPEPEANTNKGSTADAIADYLKSKSPTEEPAPTVDAAAPNTEVPPTANPKASDPAPMPLADAQTKTLGELGLTDAEDAALFESLKGLFPKIKLGDYKKLITAENLESISVNITLNWDTSADSFKNRMDGMRNIEAIRTRLLPNGIEKATQTRKKSIIQIRKKFAAHGPVFIDNAIAFLKRFEDLGYEDSAPMFENYGGDFWNPNANKNQVNLSSVKGAVSPKLTTFYHEMAHWMYGNVLTSGQRVEFMDAMGKYYKEDGSLDSIKLADALPMGSDYRSNKKGESIIGNKRYITNGEDSPQELFAEQFSIWAMRSHASPDAQVESFFKDVQLYLEYLYKRFIKQDGVIDPDLERLFINIIPNEKQHRDLLTNGVRKVSVKNAEPKTKTGEYIRIRLDQAIYANSAIEGSLGSTTIIENMKDMGAMFMSLAPQKGKGKGKTGGFKQTESINPELRAASVDIYNTIREYFSDAQGKQGGEVDWEEIESGLADLDMNAEIELSELLAKKWETGGLRELVYKLDDTLRGQYFRHEQELILSPMAKDAFPDTLEKYRDGFKIKLAWQKKKPEILNPNLVALSNKTKSTVVTKTPDQVMKSNRHALKSKSVDELTALASGEDQQAVDAAVVLLEKWRATKASVPKNFKASPKVHTASIPDLQEMIREAIIGDAAGDSTSAALVKEIRTEMARRGASAKSKPINHTLDLIVNKEERIFSGDMEGKTGIPNNISAIGREFLEMFTHRDLPVQASLRTVMFRFLNMLDMDTNSEFLGTKWLDSLTIRTDLEAHWGKIGDPNTPYAGEMLNEIDLNSPETKKFLNQNRRLVASLAGDDPEKIRDGIAGMARLALRTHAIPSSSKTAILDIYRLQPEAIKSRIRRRVGGAANEFQEMEQFFTESFINYLSGKFPDRENIFNGLNDNEANVVIDIFDDVRDSVKYLTDGVVNKKQLVGIFDELAYSEPLGSNQIKLQKRDAMLDTFLRAIEPETKDMMTRSYFSHLEKNNPARLERMNRFASGYGLNKDGELQIFWHSTPNGAAMDRYNNPILRPSKDGQHGRGIHMTTSADVGFETFAKRPTYEALSTMMQKLAEEKGIAKHSAKYQLMMAHVEELHNAQMDSSSIASIIMKGRELVDTLESRIARLSDDQVDLDELDKLVALRNRHIDKLAHMDENFIALDREISAIQKNLNADVGYKPDPVMIPLVLRADRVATFDATMHRPDSSIMTSILGRIKQLESNVVEASQAQTVVLSGAKEGLSAKLASAIAGQLNANQTLSGQSFYNILVNTIIESFPDESAARPIARSFIDDVLQSLGYEAKVGSTQNQINSVGVDGELISSGNKYYKEVVVFDSKSVKHLASDLFDEESSMLYSKSSIEEIPTEATSPNARLMMAMVNTEGNINHRGFAPLINEMEKEGAKPSLTSALVAKAKGKTLTEGQANAMKQYGPKLFFSKGSDRLRSFGMNWLGDFIQPLHGSGFHEKQGSEMARRVIPIIQKIKKLPDAKGMIGSWASKNNPLKTTQPDSVTRIVKTLRRPLGHASEKNLSPEEFEIYRDLRDTFANEAMTLKESGVMMGHIEDYFPQVWNKEAMLRDRDGVISELMKHLMRESITERNADITVDIAREKATMIFNRLTDDDGVYMPPATSGKRSSSGSSDDHIDYQRMLRLDKYPDSLKSLEKYLENVLEGLMTKYFDLSTRRVAMANKFGTNNHGYHDYLYMVQNGLRGAVDLMIQGKVLSREMSFPDGSDGERAPIEKTLFSPLTQDPNQAGEIAQEALDIAKTQGPEAARDFLISSHPKATKAWEKRADAIANALAEFEGKIGMVPEQEFKFTQGLFNTTQRIPPSPQDTFFKQANNTAKVLRSINAVSLLGWTTLTSLGDVALPLVRSGNFRAWSNGLRKWSTDPEYRQAIQRVGVAVENLTHERLTGLVGAESTKATNAFFNFTLLTPWTNMNREMAGAVFHQAIITEQRFALTAGKGTAKHRTAMRFLNRYGLAEYGKEGAMDLNNPLSLDNNAVREGMIRFANESIFTPNSNDVPLWAQTPWGSIAFQLKAFPTMMQRLMLGEGGVVSEASKANVYPALYAFTIGAGFGMASLASKDVSQARGGDDDQSMALRNRNMLKSLGYDEKVHGNADDFAGWYLDGLAQMGGLGLISNMMYDSAQQLDNGAYGQNRVMSTLLGPSVGLFGSAYNIAAGGMDATKDAFGAESTNSKERQGIRELAMRVPVIGGIKGVREGVVDTVAGESESGKSKPKSGWGGGFGGGFGGSF